MRTLTRQGHTPTSAADCSLPVRLHDADIVPTRAAAARRSLTRSVDRLRREDDGTQVAEYTMIGGASAALISMLVWVVRETDIIERLVRAILEFLIEAFKGGALPFV